MSKLSAVAKLTAREGRGDDLIAAFRPLFEHVATEPGTEHYVLHRSLTEPDVLYVSEVYTDQAALDAHMGSEAFAALGGSLGDLLAGGELALTEVVLSAKP